MSFEPETALVFQGAKALCREYSLVLEARGIEHQILESAGVFLLTVMPRWRALAVDELTRYAAERSATRPKSRFAERFSGAGIGATIYAFILVSIAYFAGLDLFGVDWYTAGVIDAGPMRTQWWRAVTALTLHADPMHLLGNLFFGVLVSIGASRLLGPGVAWLATVVAAVCANWVEMWISPASHSALGASTAVFAMLGLLTGLAWSERMSFKEQRWYRFAPMIGGVCLLSLFGAGGAHVDVLGHLLGFAFGTGAGGIFTFVGMPRSASHKTQLLCGAAAVTAIGFAWLLALY